MASSDSGVDEKGPFLSKDFISKEPFRQPRTATAAAPTQGAPPGGTPSPVPAATAGAAQDVYIDAATTQPSSQADVAIIQVAKGKANDWLDKAIHSLEAHKATPDPATAGLVNAFFKTGKPADLDALVTNYKRITANLNGGVTYRIDKTASYWGKTGALATTETTLGEVFFRGNSTIEERAGALIHEAAHRQAFPSLFGFRSKLEYRCEQLYLHDNPAGAPQAWDKLSTSDLITTPDIYAAFAAALNNADYMGYWGCMPRPLRQHVHVGPP